MLIVKNSLSEKFLISFLNFLFCIDKKIIDIINRKIELYTNQFSFPKYSKYINKIKKIEST